MNKKIILIKLGGSLITDKEKPFTAKMEIIKDLARQIKEALDENKDIQLIIGNGGGSFPHYPAVRYNMSQGIKTENQKKGFCLVQDAASQLNRIIIKELLKAGVQAVSMNPSSMIISHGGKIKDFFIEPIIRSLKLTLVPVVYGDIVIDEVFGSKIYSTEQLLGEISQRLIKLNFKIEKIIHNGLTIGVLDENNKNIPKIDKDTFAKIEKNFTLAKGFDVTGGMLHKVKESLDLAQKGIKSLIINGTSRKDLLKRAILGETVIGTVIE